MHVLFDAINEVVDIRVSLNTVYQIIDNHTVVVTIYSQSISLYRGYTDSSSNIRVSLDTFNQAAIPLY